jgi:hypothetical protein
MSEELEFNLWERNVIQIQEMFKFCSQCGEDKNSKVRREIIDVFCDFGKRDSTNVTTIIENSFLEKISSVETWQVLSYAWQGFLHSPSNINLNSDEASQGQDSD